MDEFTASLGSLPSGSVLGYIQQQAQHFQQHVGEELWGKFEHQARIIEAAAPSLTRAQIERIEMQRSQVLNPTGVEVLISEFEFKTTTEFNQTLLMSNPTISDMHRLHQIEGYGLKHDATRNTLLWNRITSGLILPDEDGVLRHKETSDDAAEFAMYNQLTALQRRVTLCNTRQAIKHVLNEVDFSSIFSGGL